MDMSWHEASGLRMLLLGLGKLDGLRELIAVHTGRRNIEDLAIRFAAVATDLDNGKPVVLDRGLAGVAVAAQASVPIRYERVSNDSKRLIDEQIRRADFAVRLDVHAKLRTEGGFPAVIRAGERAVQERWPALQAALSRRRRSGCAPRCLRVTAAAPNVSARLRSCWLGRRRPPQFRTAGVAARVTRLGKGSTAAPGPAAVTSTGPAGHERQRTTAHGHGPIARP